MPVLKSRIDTTTPQFAANAETMDGLVADLESKTAHMALGGSEGARARHVERGKLIAKRCDLRAWR